MSPATQRLMRPSQLAPVWRRHLRHCAAGTDCKAKRSMLPSLAKTGVEVQSSWYCSPACVRSAVAHAFQRASQERTANEQVPPRTLPLGLLLHSRGELDEIQLNTALRIAREWNVPIGQVLIREKMATERQITSALATQCGCAAYFGRIDQRAARTLPRSLQAVYRILPLEFIPSRKLIYVGFQSRPNYSLLMAIESILGCRPEPAIIPESRLAEALEQGDAGGPEEICFTTSMNAVEVAQICAEYAFRRGSRSIRYARCIDRFWLRVGFSAQTLDLFFRLPAYDIKGSV